MASFLSPLLETPPAACELVDARSGVVIAAEILPALDSATRNKGLLGRSSLDDRVAMILAPCMAVHTFFMQFPIDIAFVTRTGRVIKLRERVRPRRIAVALGAFAVIEMAAGAFSRSGSGAGSELIVRRQEPEPFVWRGAEVPLPSR